MTMNLRNLGPCLVCGQPAIGINFTVATCAPCKAFFRRNAVKLGRVDFVCQLTGDCPVTSKTRQICNFCRLAKCFRVGMEKSLIRTEKEKEAWKHIVQQNRDKRTQSTLVQQKSSLAQPISLYHMPQKRLEVLTVFDQTLLTNIFGVYERTYALTDKCEYPCFPAREHLTLHTYFNEYEERHKLLIDYFKSIPEFNRLTTDDKMGLVKGHFGAMFAINENILAKTIPQNLVLSFKNLFTINLANDMTEIAVRFVSYSYDPLQLKLILVILTLSSGVHRYRTDIENDRIYDDTLAIFDGQNVYVTLLWRYLLSKLPSERDAVQFFNKLILDILFLESSCLAADRYICNLNNEIDKMQPLMQDLWDISDKKANMNYDGMGEKSNQ